MSQMAFSSKELKVGAHLSCEQGLSYVSLAMAAVGVRHVQFMLPMDGYRVPALDSEDAAKYARGMSTAIAYIHLPYQLNPCQAIAQKKGFYGRMFKSIQEIGLDLGVKGLVIHPGFRKDLTEAQAFRNLVDWLHYVDPQIPLLFEVDSGSKNGSAVGSLDFIAEVLKELDPQTSGLVLDTEHLYARGVNMFEEETRTEVLEEYGKLVSLVHLNSPDPIVTLGSNLDRHSTPFKDRPDLDSRSMIRQLALMGKPMIIERRSVSVITDDILWVRSAVAGMTEFSQQPE